MNICADEPSVKRGSYFFNRGAAEASAAPEAADSADGDMGTIAAGEPLSPRQSKSDERLQRVRRLQMAQFMDQLRRTSLQQVHDQPAGHDCPRMCCVHTQPRAGAWALHQC